MALEWPWSGLGVALEWPWMILHNVKMLYLENKLKRNKYFIRLCKAACVERGALDSLKQLEANVCYLGKE